MVSLARRAIAECIGTALLLIAVVGSGIAAQKLSPSDTGIELLENAVATGAALVATFGLILVVFGVARSGRSGAAPFAVGAYITGAYFFTSSTSFANPAVTLARAFSDTFAGIAPASVLPFLVAQVVGAALRSGQRGLPVFFGTKARLHWSFPDPSRATGSEHEQLTVYRQVRDAIRRRIERELLQAVSTPV